MGPTLTGIAVPIPWSELGFSTPVRFGETTVHTGDPAWSWEPDAPLEGIATGPSPSGGTEVPGWHLDHIVVLVPSVEDAVEEAGAAGLTPGLQMQVAGRRTAFYRVGTAMEVVESPVRAAALFGVVLASDEPLEAIVLRWRAAGFDVTDPAPALERDRRIFTVRDLGAGLAVMSPHRAVSEPDRPSDAEDQLAQLHRSGLEGGKVDPQRT